MRRVVTSFRGAVRRRPALDDAVSRAKRAVRGPESPTFARLDAFSRERGGVVNFVQIGANDGLRNDPLRPLVVRDDWQGELVEPLPAVHELLRGNYAYLRRPGLVFLDVGVSVDGAGELPLWTGAPGYLATLPEEARLDLLRKSSCERDHVAAFLPPDVDPEFALTRLTVPCVGVERIVADHLPRRPLHLLAIDVEGFERELVPGLDLDRIRPEALLFEAAHLGPDRTRVFGHLEERGYEVELLGLDAFARRR